MSGPLSLLVQCTSEELLNLLGSGSLSGLAEEELEDVLGRREETAGRESRVGMYDLSDPMVQVRELGPCQMWEGHYISI